MNNLETEFKFKIDKLPSINFDKAKKYYIKQIYFDGKNNTKLLEDLLVEYLTTRISEELFPTVDFSIINTYRIRYIESDNKKSIILTVKSKPLANGLSRIEEEKEIDEDIVSKLIYEQSSNTIIKNRYVDTYNGYKFEFDEYLNLKIDLYTCEIEVDSNTEYEKEVNRFMKMIEDHYGLECLDITFNPIYKNSNLQKYFGK